MCFERLSAVLTFRISSIKPKETKPMLQKIPLHVCVFVSKHVGFLENCQNNNLHRVQSVTRVLWMSNGCSGVALWLDLLLLRQQSSLPGCGRCPSHPVSVPAESFGKVGCSFWPAALCIRLEKTQAAWQSKNSSDALRNFTVLSCVRNRPLVH